MQRRSPKRPATVNILLIGGGGREHALADAIAGSPLLGAFYATHTTNPGIAAVAKPVDVPFGPRDLHRLVSFCDKHDIDLVVIGPEDPLAAGYADRLAAPDRHPRPRLVFGPTAAGARLEADKGYAKQLMRAASIPTGEGRVFDNAEAALAFVQSRDEPYVVKAAGLAKGKGVIVPATVEEAAEAVERIMVRREFGDAGKSVVVEEKLTGPEVSVLALIDGRNILTLPICRDHKPLLDGNRGPNTGGMGAFCPAPDLTDDLVRRVEAEVLVPAVDALRTDGVEFRGVLYAGLMLTHAGPKVLEFNVRFGDPECQPLMRRLASDPIDLLWHTAAGTLDQCDVSWRDDAAVCVVLASAGYPDSPRTGDEISGIDDAEDLEGVRVYHAGTKFAPDGGVITAGGRVLGVTATGPSPADARELAYRAVKVIHFEGMQYRRDIGAEIATTKA